MANIDGAMEHLKMAYDSFARSVEAMRDRELETRGEDGSRAAREAEAILGVALGVAPPA